MNDQAYELEGQSGMAVGNIITLIVGVGIAVLVLIFVGTLGGQTYNLVEGDIEEIGLVYFTNGSGTYVNVTASDYTMQNHIKGGITSGFEALEQTGSYLPIIVLAVVIFLVLSLVLGFTAFGNDVGRGGAL